MQLSDFDFDLPDEQIARYPAERRDASRLLVLDRSDGRREHRRFAELPLLLRSGDLLVVNDTRVIPARLFARKPTGGRVELLLVEPASEGSWRAMVKGSKGLRAGQRLDLEGSALSLEVAELEEDGFALLRLPEDGVAIAERHGELPLPPYLRRDAEPIDRDRYQTVFARDDRRGSVAAPTAGLHFTEDLNRALESIGVRRVAVTLHVGPGTFLPVRADRIEDHRMHSERFEIPDETAKAIEDTKRAGGRIVAVGTTVVRTLESFSGEIEPGQARTDIFIKPGHEFRHVDMMITNFHLPRSTLLMLVAAFAGRDRMLDAYQVALDEGYRFFSYGDAMLIQ